MSHLCLDGTSASTPLTAEEAHFLLFEDYGEHYHCARDQRAQLLATHLPAGAQTLTVSRFLRRMII